MKKIPDQKLAAFSTGLMGSRGLSKRELEELKKKEEEEAAAHVFKEFVETFQEAPSTTSKVWVKAGTYDAGARKEDTSERGKLYKPTSRLDEKRVVTEADIVRSLAAKVDTPGRPGQKNKLSKDKKKSNLELFKEELRQIQEERSERHKYKNVLRDRGVVGVEPIIDTIPDIGSYDTGDPNTTNLYLGNLNPKITEQQLMEIFGRYGPLASIKIMWPRSDEEKARGRNCGFVAFMSRKDGERALRCINGKEILNYEMKLGWGKAVVIPPVPIYIPPALQQPSQPPPPSGLPFNAQPPKHKAGKIPRVRPGEYYPSDPEDKIEYEKILSQSIVKVVVPTERNILMLIHRMVEFVIREGPMFEAIIMNKEMNNPFFRFLFENQSPAHVYYRWKLFSMLQGDSPKQWQLADFRMFVGGSVWRPPVMNLYTAGMPDDLLAEDDAKDNIRGTLSNNQRDRLEELIRGLTPSRQSVGEVMAWCLEHAEAANEIAQCLLESLSGENTAPHKRIARLYLLSDILHNAGAKLTNASAYRSAFQTRLVEIMRQCHAAWAGMTSRLQQEGFRARVTRILQAWADWAVYPTDFLLRVNDVFLGQEKEPAIIGTSLPESGSRPTSPANSTASEGSWEGGGAGGPLDGAALRRLAASRHVEGDIDGVPMDEDIDGLPLEAEPAEEERAGVDSTGGALGAGGVGGAFVPSRWESVEPAPAPPTDTWSAPEPAPRPPPAKETDSEEASLSRETLREIEVRVVKYTDELEGGLRAQRPGLTHAQQIQHYRRKLIKKAAREAKEALAAEARESPDSRRRTPDIDDTYSTTFPMWTAWKEDKEDEKKTTIAENPGINIIHAGTSADTLQGGDSKPTAVGGPMGQPEGVNPMEEPRNSLSDNWPKEETKVKFEQIEAGFNALGQTSIGSTLIEDSNLTDDRMNLFNDFQDAIKTDSPPEKTLSEEVGKAKKKNKKQRKKARQRALAEAATEADMSSLQASSGRKRDAGATQPITEPTTIDQQTKSQTKKRQSAKRSEKRDRAAANLDQLVNISPVETKKQRLEVSFTSQAEKTESRVAVTATTCNPGLTLDIPLRGEIGKAKKKKKKQRWKAQQKALAEAAASETGVFSLQPGVRRKNIGQSTHPIHKPCAQPAEKSQSKKLQSAKRPGRKKRAAAKLAQLEESHKLKVSPQYTQTESVHRVAVTTVTGVFTKDASDDAYRKMMAELIRRAKASTPGEQGPLFLGQPMYEDEGLKIQCADQRSLDWLKDVVSGITTSSGEALVVKSQAELQKRVWCGILIPNDQNLWKNTDDIGIALAYQNPWAGCERWKLHSENKQQRGWFLTLSVPQDLVSTLLMHERRLACGTGSVYIKFRGPGGRFYKTAPDQEAETSQSQRE